MKVLIVAAARPNFMKVAPVLRALEARGVEAVLVHTGQHYDEGLSAAFFADLRLPEPDEHLGVGSGTHAQQTARVLESIEPVLRARAPDLVVIVGDVNSTLAAALASAKLMIPVAHVEAGLRSFDRSMPEEINRVLTDQISELLFTTSPEAEENLIAERVAKEKIHFVGNTMIDSLETHLARARDSSILTDLGLDAEKYALVTLHRPSNVDEPRRLGALLRALSSVGELVDVVFPVHPRTAAVVALNGLDAGSVRMIEPVGYVDFLRLMMDARVVLTDSGGIQEETTVLGVPCLTIRENTERPITVSMGTNTLVGTDPGALEREARAAIAAPRPAAIRPPLWDGKAGERIADVIVEWGRARAGTPM
ncbi:MAG: non-hydrolyzing UDP-N-acetylglucosamine 2-epimerase [Actinomycetota bacterium]|nr:UDP-N-acetylglucosamine 2-epimerase (non-hydrolyzing) [Actinomycetota bacterium]